MAWGWIRTHESPDVRNFLAENQFTDPDLAILKIPAKVEWSREYLHSQIKGKPAFDRKFPSLKDKKGLIIPPKKSIEQASSEISARYRASIFKGKQLVDLSMGMGGDLWFMSSSFQVSVGIEISPLLMEIFNYNISQLGNREIQTKEGDGLDVCRKLDHDSDLFFIDPDRRVGKGKVFRFIDSEPNLVGMIPELLNRTMRVLVKSSPMLDIDYGIRELGSPSTIRVISIGQECKELLFEFNKNSKQGIKIYLDWYSQKKWQSIEFDLLETKNIIPQFGDPEEFLFDPNPSVLKARAFGAIGKKFGLKKISANTHMFTGPSNHDFPGRVFTIVDQGAINELTKFKEKNFEIIMRNFPLEKLWVIKKYKIREGNGDPLILFSNNRNEKRWALCTS